MPLFLAFAEFYLWCYHCYQGCRNAALNLSKKPYITYMQYKGLEVSNRELMYNLDPDNVMQYSTPDCPLYSCILYLQGGQEINVHVLFILFTDKQ